MTEISGRWRLWRTWRCRVCSRFWQSAGRRGWRGVVLLGLVPVAAVSFTVALTTSGTVHAAAYGVYLTVAMVMLALGWRLAFGTRSEPRNKRLS